MVQEGTYAEVSDSIVQLLIQARSHAVWLE